MNLFIVCIVIFIWLTIIIVSNCTAEKKDSEPKPIKEEKQKEEPVPEVYLETISDDLLYKILPGTFQSGEKFVSISSRFFEIDFEDKSFKLEFKERFMMYFLKIVLRPIREYRGYCYIQEKKYPNRRINDLSIKLSAIYFDKNFDFKKVSIRLKIQNTGYSCTSPEENVALANLKNFLTEKPTKITEENYLFFSKKLQELERKDQDEKVKEFVEQVFSRHTEYNKEAEEYETEKAVPITSPEIFFNFCDLISYRVPSDLRSEITNYLYILCEN